MSDFEHGVSMSVNVKPYGAIELMDVLIVSNSNGISHSHLFIGLALANLQSGMITITII